MTWYELVQNSIKEDYLITIIEDERKEDVTEIQENFSDDSEAVVEKLQTNFFLIDWITQLFYFIGK